jgi:hypothetical protein
MKFLITYVDGSTEEREFSDCTTVDQALNAVAGSIPGVKVSVNGTGQVESPDPV